MHASTKFVSVALVSAVIGAAGALAFERASSPVESHMASSMEDMSKALEGKEGNAFDQMFLEEMIVHHQGAVEMAQLARTNAGHLEIKQMAEAIISTQESEIALMQEWQESWFDKEAIEPKEEVRHTP